MAASPRGVSLSPTDATFIGMPSGMPYDTEIPVRRGTFGRMRKTIYDTFDDPSSSVFAQALAMFILLSICVSIAALIVESEAHIAREYGDVFFGIEVTTTVIFTTEYVIRLMVCQEGGKTPWRFLTSGGNVVDFLAIAPFYVEIVLSQMPGGNVDVRFLKVLRAIRLVRLFRIFKVSSFATGFNVIKDAMVKSRHALYTLNFFVAVAMVIFSSVQYHAEKLLCPEFPPTPEGKLEFATYEQACRLEIENHLRAPCCEYACNPTNPGIMIPPATLPELETFAEERNATEWIGNGFPNSLCKYEILEHELKELFGGQDAPYSDAGLIEEFAVISVASSSFRSIPLSFWWAIVSMTTTGYGDEVPSTILGMCFAIMAMCFGILLIALPVAIVGSKFQEAFADMEAEQGRKRAQSLAIQRLNSERSGTAGGSRTGEARESSEETSTPPSPTSAAPLVTAAKEAAVEEVDTLASFFPALAHLVREVPEGHPARENVQRVVANYAELTAVQREMAAAQRGYVQAQQDVGKTMGDVFSTLAPAAARSSRPQLKTVRPP